MVPYEIAAESVTLIPEAGISTAARRLDVVGPHPKEATASGPAPRSLISPNTDRLMIGGLSLAMFVFAGLLIDHNQPSPTLGWTVFYLSFLVNFPHFLVSYHLLYADFGKHIFKSFRFLWAAVIVPVILGGAIVMGIESGDARTLGYIANAMFFFVGWHYVKQTFGGIVVTNALAKFYYNARERAVMKSNLFSLWAISWVSQNVGYQTSALAGIPFQSVGLPAWCQTAAYLAVGSTALAVIAAHVMKYIREGAAPTLPALFCFLSIYVWLIPALYHPMYFHLIPFFHSLQYLLFVVAFRRNKVISSLGGSLTTPGQRKGFFMRFYGYLALALVTGATFMWVLPTCLDSYQMIEPSLFGPTLALFAVTVFINIHHYFIDNVIWRGSNPEIRKHLFGAS
ncbi:MAG: hypothetical protein ACREJU_13725 [Nitrospiraceae bacterium]